MYCTYCGAKLPDRAKFCSCCGRRLDDVHTGYKEADPSDVRSRHSYRGQTDGRDTDSPPGGRNADSGLDGTVSGIGHSAVKPVFVMLGLAAALLLFSAVLIFTV